MNKELKHIPTNIITGFLGTGKTTTILHLLKQKPKHEIWAVLVNEFGKIGIDGHIIKNQGAQVKEIPGGCMCCAAGVNMTVGLNALIKQAQPDRLLIEPTGIGHPQQIIKILSKAPYNELLDMRACISLLDPRHLQNERYLSNDNFNQQIDIADILVANKTDLCNMQDRQAFHQLITDRNKQYNSWIQHGHLHTDLLNLPHATTAPSTSHRHFMQTVEPINEISLKAGQAFTRMENHEDDYFSCGWLFSNQIFDDEKLFNLFFKLDLDRIKAVAITSQDPTFYNCVNQNISQHKIESLDQSRFEFISSQQVDWDELEQKLLCCMQTS